jgi:branched-chain amino acid transport system permease protein
MLRLIVFLVVGGIGSIWGPIIGTIGLSIVSEFLRDLGSLETLAYGAILICVILFFPNGLAGGLQQLSSALRRKILP